MSLYIKKISLINFKSFEEISIYPNNQFNIIIGANNIGKTSIFEAIHLWSKCYHLYITSKGKSFYKKPKTVSEYINFNDLDFLRLEQDVDLFFNSEQEFCSITLTLADDQRDFDLGFEIIKPNTYSNMLFRVRIIDYSQFANFATYVDTNFTDNNLRNLIYISISPYFFN